MKDFNAPIFPRGGGPFQFHPYPPIRERITRARKKFGEYKEFCCAVVLYNNGAFVMLDKPDFMLGSMYGESGFTFPFNTQTGVGDASLMERAFLNRGMMINRHGLPRNTTISALITLTTIQPDYEMLLQLSNADCGKSILAFDKELAAANPRYDPERRIPRVIVWHNAVARIPFPGNLLCGPYDTHFGVVQKPDGVFQQITFRGALLPARFEV